MEKKETERELRLVRKERDLLAQRCEAREKELEQMEANHKRQLMRKQKEYNLLAEEVIPPIKIGPSRWHGLIVNPLVTALRDNKGGGDNTGTRKAGACCLCRRRPMLRPIPRLNPQASGASGRGETPVRGGEVTASGGEVTGKGGEVTAIGGEVTASGGEVTGKG
eukprot:5444325-Pyramimonas_sp.AAC.3